MSETEQPTQEPEPQPQDLTPAQAAVIAEEQAVAEDGVSPEYVRENFSSYAPEWVYISMPDSDEVSSVTRQAFDEVWAEKGFEIVDRPLREGEYPPEES